MDRSLRVAVSAGLPWTFACPICRAALIQESRDARCAQCDRVYVRSSDIWRFLPLERLARYEQFLREYHIVRKAQGWGHPDAGYFLALPHVAPNDPQWEIWRRREASCRLLFRDIINPMAARCARPLRILDLGSGNCWLAYQLTERGHQVAAVDLSIDPLDGLGAHAWYRAALQKARRAPFTLIQADYNLLPLVSDGVDVALFNASLHYSTDCSLTLREALRVLSLEGIVVIMDSPVYQEASSGAQMVCEREMAFERAYGFRSNSLPAEHYLTADRLVELAHELALRWESYGPGGRVSQLKGRWRRWRGLRELATMPIIAGKRV